MNNNDNYDIDAFVRIVGERQRNNVSKDSQISLSSDEEHGVSTVVDDNRRNNLNKKINKTNKNKLLKKVAFITFISIVGQVCLTTFRGYCKGVKKVTNDIYYDCISENGIVFKNEEGKTLAARGLDENGYTAWKDVVIEDYKYAKEVAESYGYSEQDIYTTFSTLNFEGYEDAFSEEEKPDLEDVWRYIELGKEEMLKGRGR